MRRQPALMERSSSCVCLLPVCQFCYDAPIATRVTSAFMGRRGLKTKLVLAITGMVFALVGLFSYVYVSHRLRQSTTEAYTRADFVAKEIEDSARKATRADLRNLEVDL